jgi:hypothetical protein
LSQASLYLGAWREATRRVVPFVGNDAQNSWGYVSLTVADGRARWASTNSYGLVVLHVAPASGQANLLIPPGVVCTLASSPGDDHAQVHLRGDDAQVRLSAGQFDLGFDPVPYTFPDVDGLLEETRLTASAGALVPTEALAAAVRHATAPPVGSRDEDDDEPELSLSLEPHCLSLTCTWPGLGPTTCRVAASCQGRGSALVNPDLLARVVCAVDSEEVTLRLSPDGLRPLLVEDGPWAAAIMPLTPASERVRHRVEQVLSHVFGPPSRSRRPDGSYVLPLRRAQASARLLASPSRLELVAVVLDQVEPSDELLRELNQLNSGCPFLRVYWEDGKVVAQADLPPETVIPEELVTCAVAIDTLMSDTSPALASMFGGVPGPLQPGGEEWLWERFAETVIRIEVAPRRWEALNGDKALEMLPHPPPLHVITAWNPGGNPAPEADNRRAQAHLLARLWDFPGCFVLPARGDSPDGRYSEPSLCTVGLSRQEAVRIGQEFAQSSIFEVDERSLHVVSCSSGRVVSRPRVSRKDGQLPIC